jgi:hypothetical protein
MRVFINYNVLLQMSALYVDEEMASIICNSLLQLKKPEIPSSDMSTSAIIMFLDCLEAFEYLDMSGYEASAISSIILEKASRLSRSFSGTPSLSSESSWTARTVGSITLTLESLVSA